jgi:VWFA-related protein
VCATRRRFSRLVFVAASLAFVLGPSAAPSQQEETDVSEFPTHVELVTVDVVVTDSKNRPVGYLDRADFELTEDGVPQTLSRFEAVLLPEDPTRAPARRTAVSTNVGSGTVARPGRWFGLVLDDLHLDFREAAHAREAATTLLETGVREGDQVTLATTSGEIWWTSEMTAGRDDLITLLEKVEARELPPHGPDWLSPYEAQRIWVHHDRALADYVERRFSANGLRRPDLVLAARAPEVYFEALESSRRTLEVIERMLVPLEGAGRPGALILLSGGFLDDPTLDGRARVLEASRRSNVPVHFVDSRALVGMPAHFGADRRASSVPGMPALYGLDREPGAIPEAPLTGLEADRSERLFAVAGPESLALDSAGLVVRNTNDPTRGLQRIADESRVFYLLGYYATNTARDGTYRRVEVEVRRPGLEVRARKGYRAPLEEETRTAGEAASGGPWFQRALDSPLDLAGVPLRVSAYTFEETRPGRARVVLAAEVDIRGLPFREEAGRAVDTLDVLVLVGPAGGGELIRKHVTAGLSLRPEGRKELETSGFPVLRELELAPGAAQARVVVRDRNSGRIGSVAHRFEVPDLSGLRASSVVLTDRLDPKPDWTMSEFEPRIVAHRVFPTGTVLFVHYDVYGAAIDPGTGRSRVRTGLEVRRRDGTALGRGGPVALTPSSDGRLSRTSDVRLAGTGPGDYEMVLSVTDDVTGQTLLVREEFALVDPGRDE